MITPIIPRFAACVAAATLAFGVVACGAEVEEKKDETVKAAPVEATETPMTLGGLNAYPNKCPIDCFSASTLAECNANCETKCVVTSAHLNCL